ncbi:MAG: hypothetical protein IJT72_10310 [Lachnospiraceae bacterium]|nr:hypothetical protein [Lachnospiraceae bacterium]
MKTKVKNLLSFLGNAKKLWLVAAFATVLFVMLIPTSALAEESQDTNSQDSSSQVTGSQDTYSEDTNLKQRGGGYTVTVEGGTADVNTAIPGQTVTITASYPPDGKFFRSWKCEDDDVEIDNATDEGTQTTFVMPDHNVVIEANYEDILIELDNNNYAYTGSEITPKVYVYLEGIDIILIENTDYTVDYDSNVNVSENKATVTVKLKSPRIGKASANFSITPASLEGATISVAPQTYDSTPLTPALNVKWNDIAVSPDDYTVEYKNNTFVGTATVTITGKRNFLNTSKVEGSFTINKSKLEVVANPVTKTYDGEPLYPDGASYVGLADTDKVVECTLSGSQTEAGSGGVTFTQIVIKNANDKDVTSCYDIKSAASNATALTVYERKKDTNATYTAFGTTTTNTWYFGSNEPVVLTFFRDPDNSLTYNHFIGVLADGRTVPATAESGKANWRARSGSLILTLQPEFLATLTEGNHTITALFDDGSADATITIAPKEATVDTNESNSSKAVDTTKSTSPKTGDNTPVGLMIFALFASGIMVTFKVIKQKIHS